MGFKDLFSRKKEEPKVEEKPVQPEEVKEEKKEEKQAVEPAPKQVEEQKGTEEPRVFTVGIEYVYSVSKDSPDMVVAGQVNGTVKVGDEVLLTKLGSDDDESFRTAVYGIQVGEDRVMEATNQKAVLWVEDATKFFPYVGTVLHSEGVTEKQLYSAYINALGERFIGVEGGVLTDMDRAHLTVSDVAEIWRLLLWYCNANAENDTDETREENFNKIRTLVMMVRDKLFLLDGIYAVYSKKTGEPYLFAKTTTTDSDNYVTSPPMVHFVTKAFKENLKEQNEDTEDLELRYIDNGEDKEGIRNFIREVVLLDGAQGVRILSEYTAIAAEGLIEFPNYEGMRDVDIPVENPGLVRWMLLLGQLGKPDTPEKEFLHEMYFHFFGQELVKSTFIVPMRTHGEIPQANENGVTSFKEGMTFDLAMVEGRDKEQALMFFTDWLRFRQKFGEEWQGLMQPLDGNLGLHDVIINGTGNPEAGAYITESIFNKIKEAHKKDA